MMGVTNLRTVDLNGRGRQSSDAEQEIPALTMGVPVRTHRR
jgi:hypothetical protein